MGIAENPQLYGPDGRLLPNWRKLPHARRARLPDETVEAVKALAAQGLGLWRIRLTLEDQGVLISQRSVWNIINDQWPAKGRKKESKMEEETMP